MSALPYIGSKISLISNSDIRYEGTLCSINTEESTVALQQVRSFGTEGRKQPEELPVDRVFEYVIFRGKDIKDLTVCEPAKAFPDDPAVVAYNVPPSLRATPPPMQPQVPRGPGGQQGDMMYASPPRGYQGHQGHRMQGGMRDYEMEREFRGDSYYTGGGGGRGRGGGYGQAYRLSPSRGGGTRRPVGELPAQPNQSVKQQFAEDFDFDEANAKLDKAAIQESGEQEQVQVRSGYDKVSSFFDNISCETLDRQQGMQQGGGAVDNKLNREKQRQLDTETFGAAAVVGRPGRHRRSGGFRRGGGNSYRRSRKDLGGNYPFAMTHIAGPGPAMAYGRPYGGRY